MRYVAFLISSDELICFWEAKTAVSIAKKVSASFYGEIHLNNDFHGASFFPHG